MENRKITKFERDVLRHIKTDVEEALKTVCEKYGIIFKLDKIKYSAVEFVAKMSCVIVNTPTGEIANPDKVIFEQHATRLGLMPADFGARFIFGTDTFEICGLKLGSRKYPIIAKNVNPEKTVSFGKTFKFAPSTVRTRLAETRNSMSIDLLIKGLSQKVEDQK